MTTQKNAITSLDGLRGLACVLVMLSHTSWILPYRINNDIGHVGVMLFFTLSGFLMAHHYMPGERTIRYWAAFLVRRFFRVYPLFAIVVCTVGMLKFIDPSPQFMQYTPARIIEQLLLVKGVSIFWTIPIEIKFYVLFPLIVLLCSMFVRSLRILLALWAAFLLLGGTADKISLWAYIAFFIGGMVTAMLHRQETKFTPVNAHAWGAIATVCLIIILLFGGSFLHTPSTSGPGVWEYSIFLSPFMCIALMSVIMAKGPVKKALESKAMRFLGKISYSLYLTHFFIFLLCYDFHMPQNLIIVVPIGLFAIAFAWLLYKAVELPFYKIGIKLSNRLMSVS